MKPFAIGQGHIWYEQKYIHYTTCFSKIKQRIIDHFLTTCRTDFFLISLYFYKNIIEQFSLQCYLTKSIPSTNKKFIAIERVRHTNEAKEDFYVNFVLILKMNFILF